jgi:hypothetical protein
VVERLVTSQVGQGFMELQVSVTDFDSSKRYQYSEVRRPLLVTEGRVPVCDVGPLKFTPS